MEHNTTRRKKSTQKRLNAKVEFDTIYKEAKTIT